MNAHVRGSRGPVSAGGPPGADSTDTARSPCPMEPGGGAAPARESAAAALSPVFQDYLKVIWTAAEWDDAPVSTTLLARLLDLAPSTVSETVRRLAARGLVHHERYGAITLTDEGRTAALAMVRRHRLIETFLVRVLDYGWEEVHDEAEILEHAVSDRLVARVDAQLGHPQRDPHGDPIPRPDGTMPDAGGVRLSELQPGARGVVTRISDEHPAMLRYFEELGIAPGTDVRMVRRRDYAGTVSVAVPGGTAELGDIAARAIWLEPPAGAGPAADVP